ncbi:MAG TPA: DNA/RNA helicase domain-containing protein, partial [Puia sp.]|nr:DNA/RNA helicase domain-containing protein [Puia sp.]
IFEFELESQFRCGGSDGYLNWIDNTLNIRRTANALWTNDKNFEFKIYPSVEELEEAIIQKNKEGNSARLTAGFCWEWSKYPESDGTLVKDVRIGNFERPWNARENLTHLRPGIPKAQYWAYDPNGIGQIGCVYTAQGFEFDYVGVIFGNDLAYNPDRHIWEGRQENSYDTQVKGSSDFLQLVKNTYRILLSRGMKGCYVYFLNKETEQFFRSRIVM